MGTVIFYGLLIVIALSFLVMDMNARKFAKVFSKANCLVFGKKGKGKDLFFQKMINMRKKRYYSLSTYGKKWSKIVSKEVSLMPNTYSGVIADNITQIAKEPKKEKTDIYLSDGHIAFPSQYQGELNKAYPSMPLYFGTQRHLYNANIHINYNGSYTRLWDKLREQADEYFKVLGTVSVGFGLITKIRHFEEQQAAEANVLPFHKSVLQGGESKALRRQFEATNGKITDFRIFQFKRSLHYDTRFWEKVFFTSDSIAESREINRKRPLLKFMRWSKSRLERNLVSRLFRKLFKKRKSS